MSREVDDEKSPVNCIVSVLMLREGWDVQGVTVIVGLRPYTAKANILPEQTVGRGLRLMFRGTGSGYVEHVDVIGNKKFIEFVEELEREEDMQFGTFEVGEDKVVIVNIAPDPKKLDKDISLPVLSPILTRKKSLAEEIAALDVMAVQMPGAAAQARTTRPPAIPLRRLTTSSRLQKMMERDYTIPEPQTAEEVIGYYARRIAQDVKLPSQFAALVPKVREFLEKKAFGETVNLQEPAHGEGDQQQRRAVRDGEDVCRGLAEVGASKNCSRSCSTPGGRCPRRRRSRGRARRWRPASASSILCHATTNLKRSLPGSCKAAGDVERFAKLPQQFGFAIEYTDNVGQPALLRAGFRGGHRRRHALPDRDEGLGRRERGQQGPRRAVVVREH